MDSVAIVGIVFGGLWFLCCAAFCFHRRGHNENPPPRMTTRPLQRITVKNNQEEDEIAKRNRLEAEYQIAAVIHQQQSYDCSHHCHHDGDDC